MFDVAQLHIAGTVVLVLAPLALLVGLLIKKVWEDDKEEDDHWQ